MLSYRHSFHAGNPADVLKHLVLAQVLNYQTIKDKPLDYIDTHSGLAFLNLPLQMRKKHKSIKMVLKSFGRIQVCMKH